MLWIEHGALDYKECLADDVEARGPETPGASRGTRPHANPLRAIACCRVPDVLRPGELNALVAWEPLAPVLQASGCSKRVPDAAGLCSLTVQRGSARRARP